MAKENNFPKLLKPNEVAEIFSFSLPTVYRLIKEGKLKAIRLGGSYRIREDSVVKILDDGDPEKFAKEYS